MKVGEQRLTPADVNSLLLFPADQEEPLNEKDLKVS